MENTFLYLAEKFHKLKPSEINEEYVCSCLISKSEIKTFNLFKPRTTPYSGTGWFFESCSLPFYNSTFGDKLREKEGNEHRVMCLLFCHEILNDEN